MKAKLNDIIVGQTRHRREFDEKKLERLALSLRTVGLLQPVVVDDEAHLICGERRIRAARLNGWEEIECVRKDDLDDLDREIMEFEENVQREDLGPAEKILAQSRLHTLYTEKFGECKRVSIEGKWVYGVKGTTGWKQSETAELLGVSEGMLSMNMDLARAIRTDPELKKFKTRRQIVLNVEKKREVGLRKVMVALAQADEPAQPLMVGEDVVDNFYGTESYYIFQADSTKFWPTQRDECASLIITDPLWDVDFDDQIVPEIGEVKGVIADVMKECCRVLKWGSHGFMFFAMKNYEVYKSLLINAGFTVDLIPMIWHKPGQGWARDLDTQIRYDYEPCFHFFKGVDRPKFIKYMMAVHTYNTTRGRGHLAEKPVEMLCELIEATTVEGELVIDPFCGGGSTIEAAVRTGRKCIGVDVDEAAFNMSVLRVKEVEAKDDRI